MNDSELKAYHWLQEQGYKNIEFHSRSTPDFTTKKGGFEVKVLSVNNSLVFRHSQFQILKKRPKTTILVYNNNLDLVSTFPFSKIASGKRTYEDISITYLSPRKMIGVSTPTYQRLLSRKIHMRAMEGVIQELLDIADKYERRNHKGKYAKEKK